MTDQLWEPAPAKVNLSLLVTGRRSDGYHLLDSLVVFGPEADILHGRPATQFSLEITGPFAGGLVAESNNLVLRAARALASWAGRRDGAALSLEKRLPIASGIGGGSADAAAALRLLCRLWSLQPTNGLLEAIALKLGADVPVCLPSTPARMRGIGEVVDSLPTLPLCGLLLANPGFGIATAEIFKARTGPFSRAPSETQAWPDISAFVAALSALSNDLETAALTVAPAIGDVLETLRGLPGCLLARMSGSGATCFALFARPSEAEQAASRLPTHWWSCAGPLYEPGSAALLTHTPGWGVAKR